MPKIGYWQSDEIAILVSNYRTALPSELQRLLPRRDLSGIHKKAKKLGLNRNVPFFVEDLPEEWEECNLTEGEIGWAAGFIDGEGTISIRKIKKPQGRPSPAYDMYLQVSNTKLEALHRLQALFGGTVCRANTPRWGWNIRPLFHWTLATAQCAPCLRAILPYLCLKAEQARLGLELHRIKQAEKHFHQISQCSLTEEQIQARELLYLKCRVLNERSSRKGLHFQPKLLELEEEACQTYSLVTAHGSLS